MNRCVHLLVQRSVFDSIADRFTKCSNHCHVWSFSLLDPIISQYYHLYNHNFECQSSYFLHFLTHSMIAHFGRESNILFSNLFANLTCSLWYNFYQILQTYSRTCENIIWPNWWEIFWMRIVFHSKIYKSFRIRLTWNV